MKIEVTPEFDIGDAMGAHRIFETACRTEFGVDEEADRKLEAHFIEHLNIAMRYAFRLGVEKAEAIKSLNS